MATLLTMVNDLRDQLREEPITAISATDDLTQTLVSYINRAAADVLESRTWSFDKRHNGVASFLPTVTGTDVSNGSSVAPVYIEYSIAALLFLSSNLYATRFRVTSDSTKPELSYSVTSGAVSGATIGLTLSPLWAGDTPVSTTTGTWELYATDVRLPSTVRKVLSVVDEEQPVQLYFTEDEIFTDRSQPRPSDESGDPESVVVGGWVTASYDSDSRSSGTSGMRMRIHPVPSELKHLQYSYVYRHPEMTTATDTLEGVPDRIVGLVIDRAWYFCLNGNLEADPVRAKETLRQWRVDLELAGREDHTAPNRRRVLRPSGGYLSRHPNSRWNTREVPSP